MLFFCFETKMVIKLNISGEFAHLRRLILSNGRIYPVLSNSLATLSRIPITLKEFA